MAGQGQPRGDDAAPGAGPTGLLLINLGTPESPAPADVRPYLREFLMDPRVIDIPAFRRWLLVQLILLTRPKASGEAYRAIWSDAGSPLLIHSRNLQRCVQQRLGDGIAVELGMRYGQPSIAGAMENLARRGVDRIVVFPLYPQYSSAATGSSIERVYELAGRYWNTPNLQIVPPFYDHPGFIEACVVAARPVLKRIDPERIYFSFHGLPERQIHKSDDSGKHCLASEDCCATITHVNRNCYRAQCFATARLLADRLGVPEERRVICFQSRLGRTPWIRPYTDEVLAEDASRGIRRGVILSPAFVADCLETLEELGIRAAETWREHGGEQFEAAPCVNADPLWVDAVLDIISEQSSWIRPIPATSSLGSTGALPGFES